MDFARALAVLKEGGKVTRKGWDDYGGCLQLSTTEPLVINYVVAGSTAGPAANLGHDDILADDWRTAADENPEGRC